MIPKECKRLAEVDFPIAEVSKHAAREKSIRHGHPSTLHLWWARRPLASSRAVLLALLLPDPCDPHCPHSFKSEARRILLDLRGRPRGWAESIKSDSGLRQIVLGFIADYSNWDRVADLEYLAAGSSLVQAAHGEATPLVVDPFAGGGSIPLEALRLGCETFASDLNPVACLILKVLLEDIPRYGLELAVELEGAGAEIKQRTEGELAELYPADPDGATPVAYLWARTVRCEAPDCGAEIPLMRSFWLCKKANRKKALRPVVQRTHSGVPNVSLEVFEPSSVKAVRAGTVVRAKATCVCCEAVLPPERVRTQLANQKGGAEVVFDGKGRRIGGARMTAVVTLWPKQRGRHYRPPTDADYAAVRLAHERVANILGEWERGGEQGLCPVPDEPLPPIGTLGFRVQRYGMLEWGDLFTARQKAALVELAQQAKYSVSNGVTALRSVFALVLGRVADYMSAQCVWHVPKQLVAHTFGRQALPITWDFVEIAPLARGPGNVAGAIGWITKVIETQSKLPANGQTQSANATAHPLPDQAAGVLFTDPPYYDAIPYSDLSDFFLVWLKRVLPSSHPIARDPSNPANPLSPKQAEIVQDETKQVNGQAKDRLWFEEAMGKAFAEGRRVLKEDGVGSVVFAHKTTEGWEALLSGMIRGGWTITGSWPIATEMASRLRARDSAALATSIHLVCRPRPQDAPVGDWADVLRELPMRVSSWMVRLQGEGIRGADLVFACVGPALEIFSRYRSVETAEGRVVSLAEYLVKVWEVVGRTALEQVLGTVESTVGSGVAGVLEEDARLTALFLWTIQSTEGPDGGKEGENSETAAKMGGGGSLPFDVVRRFAQPMGIDLDAWTGRIVEQQKGVVRLLPVSDRAKQLFGEDGSSAAADWIEHESRGSIQGTLFPELESGRTLGKHRRGRGSILQDGAELQAINATTLDRVHAAMLLQASGHASALRTLIEAELDRGPEFLQLANALSALYLRGSADKRLLDAMLLAVPR